MDYLDLANKLERYYQRIPDDPTIYSANLALVRQWKSLLQMKSPTDRDLDMIIAALESKDLRDGTALDELNWALKKWCNSMR